MTDTSLSAASLPPAQRPRRFKTPRTVAALILREMATSYGRSPGGYAWAILEPVGGIMVLSVVFSFIMRAPALGSNFALFYATGYLSFMMYSDLASKIMGAIGFSRPLLAYPGVTWLDAVLGRFILNTLTHVTVLCVVIAGISALFETGAALDLPLILLSLAMAAALGLGVGTLNCFLGSVFPVWPLIWGVVNRPMFIISGVFFLYDGLPEKAQNFLWYNPLIHVTAMMRDGFYPTYDPTFVSPFYVFAIALLCFVLGLVFLNRYHRDILND